MRTLLCIYCVLIFGSPVVQARDQVFAGVTDSGSILLSSQPEPEAQNLLMEADLPPMLPSPVKATRLSANIPAVLRAYITEASTTYNLPEPLLHAVIRVESNYNISAVSSKGARGLMQIMPATAKRFGASNLFDARQNILTGSHYLRWLLDYFEQNLELSIAAYNAGEGAVMQAGRKVPQILETQRYVPKVLALYHQLQETP